MAVSEGELVDQARAGDDVAFASLVRHHSDAAWRLAALLLHDATEAEDAVQDTFIRAHRALPGFRGDAPFRSWLLTICRRVCVDRLRRKRLETVPLDEPTLLSASTGPEIRVVLERLVATLPVDEREAFVLVDVLGHTREDAAGIVDAPASTIRTRVARARRRLADALDHTTP